MAPARTHIAEIRAVTGDEILTEDLFLFDYAMGVDDDGRYLGHLKATGKKPAFADRLGDVGVEFDDDVFTPEEFARRAAPRE